MGLGGAFGRLWTIGGNCVSFVSLVISIIAFYQMSYVMKMNGGPDGQKYCNPSVPEEDENGVEQPWTCPEDVEGGGAECCWNYLQSTRLPSDAVLVDWDFWVFDCMGGFYDEDGDLFLNSGNCYVPDAEKVAGEEINCKDLSGEPVIWINTPLSDYSLETAAMSSTFYMIIVCIAVLVHTISECYFGALSWGCFDPPKDEDFRKMLNFAPTVMNWFCLFPTILPSAAGGFPPKICLQLSDIGGLPAEWIISISRYWLGLGGLSLACIVFAACFQKQGDDKNADNAVKIAIGVVGLMMGISALLSLYLEAAGMIQDFMSLTTGVFFGCLFADIGRLIECCAGDYMAVATSE